MKKREKRVVTWEEKEKEFWYELLNILLNNSNVPKIITKLNYVIPRRNQKIYRLSGRAQTFLNGGAHILTKFSWEGWVPANHTIYNYSTSKLTQQISQPQPRESKIWSCGHSATATAIHGDTSCRGILKVNLKIKIIQHIHTPHFFFYHCKSQYS